MNKCQFTGFSDQFGFLYRIGKLKNMEDSELFKHCQDLQVKLSYRDLTDIDAVDLKDKIIIFRNILEENTTALQALDILQKSYVSFPNIYIALRVMLTIHITSVGVERSSSKLKLIKSYLRSTI